MWANLEVKITLKEMYPTYSFIFSILHIFFPEKRKNLKLKQPITLWIHLNII